MGTAGRGERDGGPHRPGHPIDDVLGDFSPVVACSEMKIFRIEFFFVQERRIKK